ARLKRGEAINQLIVQDKNRPVSLEEQVVYLYALNKGILDDLSTVQIRKFKFEILEFLRTRYPEYITGLREGRDLQDEMKTKLESCLKEYLNDLIR
ncbi:MAG: F0F1 ATP synthase subunit alpha, partial [Candidatus Omnitrophica bacterium]|nr:F0F1 ATP synthase subunit alpha [Candidatus Omnitrophota bacterium]